MKRKLLAFTAFLGLFGALLAISGCKKEQPGNAKIESIAFKEAQYEIPENDWDLNLKNELVVTPASILETEKIAWSVSDEEIAVVTGSFLEPKRPGDVTITATIQEKSASCKVHITEQPVTDIKIMDAEIADGEVYIMKAATKPEKLPLSKFKWKSSDVSIVQVFEPGQIKGIKPGTATITASYGDDISSTATITVSPVRVESVTFKPAGDSHVFENIGDRTQLEVTVKPKNATYGDVTWKTSNPNVATITQDDTKKTKVWIECKGEGEAVITATADNVTASTSFVFNATPVSKVTLSKTSHIFKKTNESITLTATLEPNNATYKTVTWKSSNTSVAAVNNGVVTCKGYGKAVITATSGSQSATCDIVSYEMGTITDCRNNTYSTVKIGNQWWMAENLRCDKYDSNSPLDGTTIGDKYTDARADGNWDDWYKNNTANKLSYEQHWKLGYLYTYNAAIGAKNNKDEPTSEQGICPNGWRLPSFNDWNTLCETVCGIRMTNSSNTANHYLQTTSGWYDDKNGTDDFMFSCLPSGYVNGASNKVYGVGQVAIYWTHIVDDFSLNTSIEILCTRKFMDYSYDLKRNDHDKAAVRCVKN